MDDLEDAVDAVARGAGFSGVVRLDGAGQVRLAKGYGFAHRGWARPNTVDTRLALASGGKGLTALTLVSLIEEGQLDLTTTARSVLGDDLPLIHDEVTIEHLLGHRSGIGDYLDEDDGRPVTDYLMAVPVHELETTEQYLGVLGGHEQKFAPGERFSYCNGGYVVLALIAERVAGTPFPELVQQRVCRPAGMGDTDFLRSDELPGGTALGYLGDDGPRSNVFHLPVKGNGDGGIYSTVADIHAFWDAFFSGRIVSPEWVAAMVHPRSVVPSEASRYGLGFWLHESRDVVMLEGYDAGVSFRTVRDPGGRFTVTVIANTTKGAWPVARHLEEIIGLRSPG